MLIDRDIRLVLSGIVVTAYMTISYEFIKDLLKTPINVGDIIITVIAGLGSLVVGFGVFFFLIYKKLKISNPET
ncbi:MAG: hypothetical protein WBF38_02315 [Nitrosotalea sp.]